MESDHPRNHREETPALEPVDGTGSEDEAERATLAPFEFEPGVATQFAEIREDYGRERLRKAMRRGLTGPAAFCGASILCFFVFRLLIPEAILYVLSIVSLVRVWQFAADSTVLDESEKKLWKRRLWQSAAFVAVTGLIYAVFILFFLIRALFLLTPNP